jgi:hypothetical protein
LGKVQVPELSGITVISVPSDGNDGFYPYYWDERPLRMKLMMLIDTPPPWGPAPFLGTMQTLAGDYHDVLFRGGEWFCISVGR